MKALIFVFSLLVSCPLFATEMVGALSAGMGGTGRSAVEPSEAVYLNPASIALLNKFYTGVSYQSGFTEKNVSRNTYSVTMSDGTEGIMFPGSLGYRRHFISDNGFQYKEDEFKGGLGTRLNDRFAIGIGGSYLRAEATNGIRYTQSNMDAGVLIGLQPNWGLSLTGENLIKADDNIPLSLRRMARVSLGTQYVFDRAVTFRYETLMPLHTKNTQLLGHRFGLGVLMKGNFFLNGGYSVDDSNAQNWGSLGLAWRGPRLKLAYSMQRENRSGLGTRHLVDLWMDI